MGDKKNATSTKGGRMKILIQHNLSLRAYEIVVSGMVKPFIITEKKLRSLKPGKAIEVEIPQLNNNTT